MLETWGRRRGRILAFRGAGYGEQRGGKACRITSSSTESKNASASPRGVPTSCSYTEQVLIRGSQGTSASCNARAFRARARFSLRLAACLAVVAAACSAESLVLEPPAEPPVPVPPVEVSVPLSEQDGEPSSSTVESPVSGSAGELMDEGAGSGAGEGADGGDGPEGGAGALAPVAPVVPESETEEPGVGGPDGGSQEVFVDVSAGLGYSCGLRDGGSVECWESGWNGSLPDEWWERDIRDSWSGDPADAAPPAGAFVEVSAGWGNACGLRPSGEVECWGRNRSEVVFPPSGVFTEVSVGVEHACGVRVGGRLECWGFSGRRRPAGLPPGGVFLDFAVGHDFGCGVRPDRSVECWGGWFHNLE